MEALMLAATVASLFFAWRAASAAADAVSAARAARADDRRHGLVARLERIAEIVDQLAEAVTGTLPAVEMLHEAAGIEARVQRGQQRLAAMIAATGFDLPACAAFASAEIGQVRPNVGAALDEVHDRVADLEAEQPGPVERHGASESHGPA